MPETKTKILVVDDDLRLRDLLNRYLTEQGFSVRAVPDATDMKVAQFGDFTFHLATRTLTKKGADVPLTTGEFALLKVLVQHPRTPLSRDKLMELARGREFGAFDRSIDVQVSRLRRLIEPDPAKPVYIQTVWGFGYVFIPDGKAGEEAGK